MTPTQPGEIDLEALLFQPGDLPAEISGSRADDPEPANFENDPPAATIVGLRFERAQRGAGMVSVLLYASTADLDRAYRRLTNSVRAAASQTAQSEPGLGDKAVTARLSLPSSTYGTGQVAVVVFARCRALVDLRMNEWMGMTLDTVIAYAQLLDRRLSPIVCG
jgi:hypothetical protein